MLAAGGRGAGLRRGADLDRDLWIEQSADNELLLAPSPALREGCVFRSSLTEENP